MKKAYYISLLSFLLLALAGCFKPQVPLNDILKLDDTKVNLTTQRVKLITSTGLDRQADACAADPLPDGCGMQAKNSTAVSVTFPNKRIDIKPGSLSIALGISQTLQLQIDKRIPADAMPRIPQTMRLNQATIALEFSGASTFKEGAEAKDVNLVFTLEGCVDDASNAQKQLCSYKSSSNTTDIFKLSVQHVDKLYELITTGEGDNSVAITVDTLFDQLKSANNTNANFPASATMIISLQEGATTAGL